MSLKRIADAINKYQSFLISAHVNLDGDALCSELALAALLKSKGKTVYIVNESKTPSIYNFLPKINSLKKYKKKDKYNFDVAILLDSSNISRIGEVANLITEDKFTIVIDHHVSNNARADINLVRTDASSTSEIIYDLFKMLKCKINKEIATFLYVGILTDTGSFRYRNTSSYTHEVVADLLRLKLAVDKIYRDIYELIPACEIRLVIDLLKNFKLDASGRIAWLAIKREVFLKNKLQIDLGSYILGLLRSMKDVEVALLFKESRDKKRVEVNFRSNDKVDVSKFAAKFGGGGHKLASGCIVKGSLGKIEKIIISKLKKELK